MLIRIIKWPFLIIITLAYVIACSPSRNTSDMYDNPRTDSLRLEMFNNEISKLGLTDGDTLVDIGSSTGFFDFQLFHFYPNKFYILEDIYKKYEKQPKNAYMMIDGQRKYFKDNFLRITGTNEFIPLRTNGYKTVICRKTVHEFKNTDRMINELKRILAVDGVLIIIEALPKTEGEIDPGCKMKHLTKEELVNLFSQYGFSLISSDTTNWTITQGNQSATSNMNILKFTK